MKPALGALRLSHELIAGLAAAAVVLPQAVGLGIAFWQQAAQAPALGAAAGLIAGACLSATAALMRGTAGMIAAPTGPTFALLAGAASAFHLAGVHDVPAMATTVAALVAMAGILQMFFGWLGLGAWIKFIPYPVVAGFMTGAGILMIVSQLPVVKEGTASFAAFVGSVVAMGVTQRFFPRWPSPLVGVIGGIVVFFLAGPFVGVQPTERIAPDPVQAVWPHPEPGLLDAVPWGTVIVYAAALAVLASLDTLLTSVVADVTIGARHNARRELIGQGMGHLIAAPTGGIAGAGTTAATLVALRLHGRHWAGLVAALAMLAGLVLLPSLSLLPKAAFAGVIAWVGFSLIDAEMVRWLRMPHTRLDGLIAAIVAGVTVAYDLMAAVALGVVLAVIEFIRTQARDAVVRRRWTRNARPSVRRRPRKERAFLAEQGERIVGYDLKGVLFFGTAEQLRNTVERDLASARFLIFDLRRVLQIDLTAWRLLAQMDRSLRARGGELLLSHLPASSPKATEERLRQFAETNEAVEYAEDALLKEAGIMPRRGGRIALHESELFSGLPKSAQQALQRMMRPLRFTDGEAIFRAGDFGKELFVLLAGEVSVWLRAPDGGHMRLAVYEPGASFGELSFLEPGARAADAIAQGEVEVIALSCDDFDAFAAEHPQAAKEMLLRMARDLAEHLRMADQALLRLIE